MYSTMCMSYTSCMSLKSRKIVYSRLHYTDLVIAPILQKCFAA